MIFVRILDDIVVIILITDIPRSIKDGFIPYSDLFPRSEAFQHVLEYATGLVVLPQPAFVAWQSVWLMVQIRVASTRP